MIDITEYGLDPIYNSTDPEILPARVTAVYKDRFALICREGPVFAQVKSGSYYTGQVVMPTTGDFVRIRYNPTGISMIVETLPRKTYFARLDPSSSGHGAQAVAANFDYVFILQSLNHDFNPNRLTRYMTLAWQSRAEPVVILTKADLLADSSEMVSKACQIAAGAAVHPVSAKTGVGLDALRNYFLPGKTVVFLGSSGVGKSSLVNALAGQEVMSTGEIREDDSRGRHTTTNRQLLKLPSGALVIDTPGMRELGMWNVEEGLNDSFWDVEQYLGRCRFSDCRHQSEPGCAIRLAIQSGELSASRWAQYQALKKESGYSDDKETFMMKKQRKMKSISIQSKQIKKSRSNKQRD